MDENHVDQENAGEDEQGSGRGEWYFPFGYLINQTDRKEIIILPSIATIFYSRERETFPERRDAFTIKV